MRLHFGGYTLDEDRRELLHGEQPVHLSPKAFRLLQLLAVRYPATVSKEEIFDVVWPDTFVAESNLPIVIKDLRTALSDDARKPRFIRTVFSHGYSLAAEVTKEETAERAAVTSIAVLPLANAAGVEWDYVAEGISESIIDSLVRLRGLRVLPRSTTFRHASADETPAEIGRRLRVDCVCSGQLRVRGAELLVHTELIHVASGSLLWSERFRRTTANFSDLQVEIAGEILSRLRSEVDPGSIARAATRNGEAYRLFLLGRHYLMRRESRSFKRALESFAAATKLDPHFAAAHAAAAETYAALATRESMPPADVFPLARRAALRAIELDKNLSSAHSALAAVQELFDWDWTAAEQTHLHAIGLDPQCATAAQWYALHLARRGRHGEAERWISKALLLEPASAIINTNAALIAYLARDFTRAVSLGASATELNSEFDDSRLITEIARTQLEPTRAATNLRALAERTRRAPHILANLACACAAAGCPDEARSLHDELDDAPNGGHVSSAHKALAALACGDREDAIRHLSDASASRSPWLSYIGSDIRIDVIRNDPSVANIIAAMSLES